MDPIFDTLWNEIVAGQIEADEEIEQLRGRLMAQLAANTDSKFTEKICDFSAEAEDCASRAAFRQGFCLGGQLVRAMFRTDFTPS